MNLENITFDNFMSLSSYDRAYILNDIEPLKILVKKNMSDKRYNHSLNVAELSMSLAYAHHVDPIKAYKAGLLHDVCKDLDDEMLIEYLKYYDPEKLEYSKGVYHAWVAKYYLKEKTNFHDKDILNAIYNHTICNSKDKLSLILYIADKREATRNINDGIVDIAYKNLYEAYDKLVIEVEKCIKEIKNERFIENSL